MIVSLFTWFSCSDDDNTEVPNLALPTENMTYGKLEAEPMAKYAAKFTTTDPSATFESIEFLGDNTYVITPKGINPYSVRTVKVSRKHGEIGAKLAKRKSRATVPAYYDDPYIRGTYNIDRENRYVLDNKDIYEVSLGDDGKYVLTYTNMNTGRTSIVHCDKAAPIIDKASQSLCRTWRHKASHSWVYVNGVQAYYERVDGSEYEELREVIFTPFGTYICYYNDGEVDQSTWQWEDAEKGILFYDWQDETEPDAEGFVTVRFAGQQARFYEDYSYGREEALENEVIDEEDLSYIEDEYGTIKNLRSLCVTELEAKMSGGNGDEETPQPPTPNPPTPNDSTLNPPTEWSEFYGAWGYAGTKLMEFTESHITFYNMDGSFESVPYKKVGNRIYHWIDEGGGSWTNSYDEIIEVTKDLFIAQEYSEDIDGNIIPGQVYSYFRLPQEPNSVGPFHLLFDKPWITYLDGEPSKLYVKSDGVLYLDGIECKYVYNSQTHELTLNSDGDKEVFKIVKLTDRIVYFDVMVNGQVDDKLEYRCL